MESALAAAEGSGMVPTLELLVAGFANRDVAREHPEWRTIRDGRPWGYMGPWLCPNSPYLDQVLLPA